MTDLPSILDAIGNTPLVPLARVGRGLAAPVLAKCEHMNPGGSVKDRLALAIVDDAERRGALRRGATIIEATAGNTGVGLALCAAVRGYRLVCVMPEKMSLDKRRALAVLGAEVLVTRNAPPDDPDNFQNVARRLAEERGFFLADQFRAAANARIHEETTGPEIVRQVGGPIGAFVAGVGTGGTITGVGRCLRRQRPAARVVLADPVGSALAAHVRAFGRGSRPRPDEIVDRPYLVEGIGSSVPPEVLDLGVIDAVEEVSDEESFATAGRLLREEGLLVGGSSGTAVAAALRVAARGGLDGPVVALLADSWDRYLSLSWMHAMGGG